MRQFFEDFVPLLVFLILNSRGAQWFNQPPEAGFFIATCGFMAALFIALGSVYLRGAKPTPMQWTTLTLVVVFGGLTLYFQDEKFIKLKPTIVYLLGAAVLTGGLLRGVSLLQKVLGSALHLSETGWLILTRRWVYFLVFCALLNEWARHTLSTDDWVSFKVFAYLPLTFIFMLSQARLLATHEQTTEDPHPPKG